MPQVLDETMAIAPPSLARFPVIEEFAMTPETHKLSPPPLKDSAELSEIVEERTVNPVPLEFIPPPDDALPFVKVKPLRANTPELLMKTLLALLPEIRSLAAPVEFEMKNAPAAASVPGLSAPLVKVIVQTEFDAQPASVGGIENEISSSFVVAFAARIAARRLPAPESRVFVTTIEDGSSNAPMSVCPTRARPRWSVVGAPVAVPALTAGDSGKSACVCVVPP